MPAIEYLRGDHYVIASGDMVALCDARTPSAIVAQLYAAVNDGGLDATRVMQSVLDIDMSAVPSLAVVTEGEKHWHLLVRGDAHVDVLTLEETWTVDAPGVLTWSESTIEEADGFILRFAAAVPEQGDVYPLEGGIVAAECAFLPVTEHARAAMAAAEAAAAAPAVAAAQSVSAQEARLRASGLPEDTRMVPQVAAVPGMQAAPMAQSPMAAQPAMAAPSHSVPGHSVPSHAVPGHSVPSHSLPYGELPGTAAAGVPTGPGQALPVGLDERSGPSYIDEYVDAGSRWVAEPTPVQQPAPWNDAAVPTAFGTSTAHPGALGPDAHLSQPMAPPATGYARGYAQPAAPAQPPAFSQPRDEPTGFDAMTLVLSSGSVVTLDRPVVLGRAPQQTAVPDVINPRLVPFIRASDEVSRTHLLIERAAGEVFATDLGSRNGTMIVPAGAQPYRLGAGERARVALGTRLDLGDGSIATLEAAR